MPEIATSTRLNNDSERLARRRLVNKLHAKKYYLYLSHIDNRRYHTQ